MSEHALSELTDGELRARGEHLKQQAEKAKEKARGIEATIPNAQSSVTESTLKLLIDIGLAIAGLIGVSFTNGWSLIVTLIGLVRLIWDCLSLMNEVRDLSASVRQARVLRDEAIDVARELATITDEMHRRRRP